MEVEIGIGKSGRRAYGFDDIASDTNYRVFDAYPSTYGTDSTTLVLTDSEGTAAANEVFGQDGEAATGRQSDEERRFVRAGKSGGRQRWAVEDVPAYQAKSGAEHDRQELIQRLRAEEGSA